MFAEHALLDGTESTCSPIVAPELRVWRCCAARPVHRPLQAFSCCMVSRRGRSAVWLGRATMSSWIVQWRPLSPGGHRPTLTPTTAAWGVIDHGAGQSHLSWFTYNRFGELTASGASIVVDVANGVAIMSRPTAIETEGHSGEFFEASRVSSFVWRAVSTKARPAGSC